jgi:hypothetical protein
MQNPFHASFGVSPPLLVGRDDLLDEFAEALEDGPGSAGRATLYTGARGAGKTVMLNAVEDRAREQGWLIISETANPGFVSRITQQHLPRLLRDFDPKAVQRRISGVSAPLHIGSLTWSTIEAHIVRAGLRSQLEMLTDLLAEQSTGILITLDEIHQNQIEELRELATVVQHTFRENRELAFAGAGLAASVSDVVNDDVLTFLRRAERHTLGSVAHADVERALREPTLCPTYASTSASTQPSTHDRRRNHEIGRPPSPGAALLPAATRARRASRERSYRAWQRLIRVDQRRGWEVYRDRVSPVKLCQTRVANRTEDTTIRGYGPQHL